MSPDDRLFFSTSLAIFSCIVSSTVLCVFTLVILVDIPLNTRSAFLSIAVLSYLMGVHLLNSIRSNPKAVPNEKSQPKSEEPTNVEVTVPLFDKAFKHEYA